MMSAKKEVKRQVHIGTSGWHYEHCKGPFYPEDFLAKEFLSFYSDRFSTVEINNSFYQLPERKTLKQWYKTVGNDFIFSVKASRYMTHMKKLKDPDESLSTFFRIIHNLGSKLGPGLFQLPPKWHINTERLESFLSKLPKQQQCAFEFRDKSWFDESVYILLSEYNAAFCIYELSRQKSPEAVTSDYIYVRLHGPKTSAYEGNYSKKRLNTWAKKLCKWVEEGREIYCFFDNDQKGFAAKNALDLQQIVDSRT